MIKKIVTYGANSGGNGFYMVFQAHLSKLNLSLWWQIIDEGSFPKEWYYPWAHEQHSLGNDLTWPKLLKVYSRQNNRSPHIWISFKAHCKMQLWITFPLREEWSIIVLTEITGIYWLKHFAFLALFPITDLISSLLHFILSTCMLCIYGNALFFFGTNVAMCIWVNKYILGKSVLNKQPPLEMHINR